MEVQPQEMDEFESVLTEPPDWLAETLKQQSFCEPEAEEAIVLSLGFI